MIEVMVKKIVRDHFVTNAHKTKTLLRTFLIAHPHKSEYLFIKCKNGEQLAKSSIHSMTLAIKKKLGIKEDFNPHSWRHTFATSFIRNKGNIVILKELLGHSNVRTT
jgi:integrase